MTVSGGGKASGTTVNSGGFEFVSSGGTDSRAIVNSGGQIVVRGGTDISATVNDGGFLTLSGGTSISASLVGSDGSNGGGHETVSSGGTASGTTLSASAVLVVSSGGLAINTTAKPKPAPSDSVEALAEFKAACDLWLPQLNERDRDKASTHVNSMFEKYGQTPPPRNITRVTSGLISEISIRS